MGGLIGVESYGKLARKDKRTGVKYNADAGGSRRQGDLKKPKKVRRRFYKRRIGKESRQDVLTGGGM